MSHNERNRSPSGRRSYELNPPVSAVKCTSDLGVHSSCLNFHSSNKVSATALRIHFGNIRGLKTNLNCVHHHLETRNPDILVLTETQVAETVEENQFFFNKYRLENQFVFHRGVCVFVKENIAYARTEKYETKSNLSQTIVLKITFPNKILFLISLYRSPENNPIDFFSDLTNKVDEISSKYPASELIVVGDFNVHHIDWLGSSSTDVEGTRAKLFADSHNLSQIVSQPTFIPHREDHHSNILDLCLTSVPNLMTANVERSIGNSDHCLVATSVQIVPPAETLPPLRRIWNFSKGDYKGLGKFYKGFPWEMHCFSNYNNTNNSTSVDIDTVVQNFTDAVTHGMNRFIPSTFKSPKSKKIFSKKSAKAVREKKCAYNKYLQKKISYDEYRKIRNHTTKVCDEEVKKIEKAKANKASSYTIADRQFYKLVGSVAQNNTKPSLPPLQTPDGPLVSNSTDKANLLADLFAKNSTLENPNNQTPPSL